MTTDTSERGLEDLICAALTGAPGGPQPARAIGEAPAAYRAGWIYGSPQDYDRHYCVDVAQLAAFLQATQPEAAAALSPDAGGPARNRFLDRLKREISSRGIIDVLRKGVRHGPHEVTLFYGTPTPGNALAGERHRREPLLGHPPAPLQRDRRAACP